MLKRITVLNRHDAVKYTRKKNIDDKAAMISIGNVGNCYGSRPVTCPHVPLIQSLSFDDVTSGLNGIPMVQADANLIARFVEKIEKLGFTHLIVHCDAGMSRSVAVAEAIANSRNLPHRAVHYTQPRNRNEHVYELLKETLDSYITAQA